MEWMKLLKMKIKTFYIGVQFHLKSLYKKDSMNNIFLKFLDIYAQHKKEKIQSFETEFFNCCFL